MSDGGNTCKGRNDSGTGDGATPTVDKYLDELRRKLRRLATIGQRGPFAFRGHASSEWKLKSTAYRRHESEPSWEELIKYNCDLVADAKDASYHQKENKQLKDIEMLAELRHYSAATSLIDFTRDFLVALWFACNPIEWDSQEGQIFVVNTGDTDKFLRLTSQDKEKSLEEILRFQTHDRQNKEAALEEILRFQMRDREPPELWYWEPRFEINHRLSSQKGVFIFGKGDIPCQEEIRIPGEDKEAIREELSTLFGIKEKSLFNDLYGFATSNDVSHTIHAKTEADYLRAGISYHQKGELEKAIEQYDKAIGQNSKCAEAYNNRGVAKLLLGRPQEALPDFDQAIKLDPQNATAYNNRGTAKVKLGLPQEALQDFDQAIKLTPKNATAYKNRGTAKIDLGLPQEALQDLDQAIKLNPQDATAYKNRGTAKIDLGLHKEALQDFDQAIKLNPQDATAYYFRAKAHAMLGDTTAARADLNKALDLATKQANKELAKLVQEDLEDLKQPPPTT